VLPNFLADLFFFFFFPHSSLLFPVPRPRAHLHTRTRIARTLQQYNSLLRPFAQPWCIPFKDRLLLFQHIIRQQRDRDQDGGDVNSAVRVRVRRSQIFDDALRRLNPLGTDLRKRIYVVFVNPLTGEDETGIDAGGLFKELWTTLSGVAFDPNYGLWDVTPQTHLMYPSANAHLVHGRDNQLVLYEFLGRVLGKAMFEGIVVQPNFAHFFLTKLLGKFSALSDLASLDEELFRNLMFLKTYEGDARDLMLNFVVTEETLGVTREIELCRGGADLDVTSRNKLRYVYHVANYRLNTKIRPQCAAFLKGLRDLIPVDWLRMFSERELQWLISGSDAAIDVDDLRAHTNYTGGYTSLSGGVRKFWAVVGAFSKEERSQLLRFVTSCERAPPLGFKALHPPFNVQWVGGAPQKLPSASTCFNTLKVSLRWWAESWRWGRCFFFLGSVGGARGLFFFSFFFGLLWTTRLTFDSLLNG
jgi:ubiquitin-protein ligase E3 C